MCCLALAACGGAGAAGPPTMTPLEARGQVEFKLVCSRCHATIPNSVVVGPSLAGIADRAGSRVAGVDAETYLRNSILTPDAYVVEGYASGVMPPDLAQDLTEEDIDALVAYLLTLRE